MKPPTRSDFATVALTISKVGRHWLTWHRTVVAYQAGITAQRTDRDLVTSSGHTDPTGTAAVTNQVDDIDTHIRTVWHHLRSIIRHLADLEQAMTAMTEPAKPGERRDATTALCQACGRTVACTDTDRLKKGLCGEDYMLHRRWAEDDPTLVDNAAFCRRVKQAIEDRVLDRPDSPYTPQEAGSWRSSIG